MQDVRDESAEPSRRSFLKKGLLGGALLAAGGVTLVALRKGKHEPVPERPLLRLAPEAFPVLVAVAARVIPDPKYAVEIAHAIDSALTNLPPAVAADFGKIFGLLENGLAGLLTRGSATPFTALDAAGQDAALAAWRDSRISILNGAYNAVRKMCLGPYYSDTGRALAHGLPGPLYEKPEAGAITARGPLSPPFIVAGPHPELNGGSVVRGEGAAPTGNSGGSASRGEGAAPTEPAGARGRRGGAPPTGDRSTSTKGTP